MLESSGIPVPSEPPVFDPSDEDQKASLAKRFDQIDAPHGKLSLLDTRAPFRSRQERVGDWCHELTDGTCQSGYPELICMLRSEIPVLSSWPNDALRRILCKQYLTG